MQDGSAANVVSMLPTWPEVRCDGCRKVYTPSGFTGGGFVTTRCPFCGHTRFSTTMVGDVPAQMLGGDDGA